MAVAAAAVDAYAVFLQARSAVTSARYPRRLDYTIVVSGIDGDRPKANHYRASADFVSGEIRVASISTEELAQPPPLPHGFNFALTAQVCGGRCETGVGNVSVPVGPPAASPDILGVPVLEPTYTFGLRYRTAERAVAASSDGALPTIAVVSTKKRDYAVTLLDEPVLDSVPTYHLRLTPLRKPKENRLRELWVGMGDNLPRKAVVAGNFTQAPLVDVPWTVDFTVFDGVPLVARESANATLFLPHRRVVRDASIVFENARQPDGSFVGEPLVEPSIGDTTLVEP